MGQHQDDLAESQIMNLSRGSGIDGITTLRAKDNEYRRPLLSISKAEIYELGEEQNWQWVEDESNKSNDYLRNRIRNHLIPYWNEIIGYDIKPLLARLANNLEADADALAWANQESYNYCLSENNQLFLSRVRKLPKTILKAVVEIWLEELNFSDKVLSANQIEQIWQVIHGEHGNKIIKLGDGIQIKRIRNRLSIKENI